MFIEWVLGIIKAVSTHDFLPTDKNQFFIRLQAEYFIRHQQRALTQRVGLTIPRRIVSNTHAVEFPRFTLDFY